MQVEAEVIREQLDHLLRREDALFKNQLSIKTWTVTVWAAVFAAIATQRVTLTWPMALFALSAPIILFWFLDGVYGGVRILLETRGMELERRIAMRDYEFQSPSEIFVLSGYQRDGFSTKAHVFLRASLVTETNTVFYTGLLAATLIAVRVFVR
jgi:hypothetical protein